MSSNRFVMEDPEFWKLLESSSTFARMSTAIMCQPEQINEALEERAFGLMQKAEDLRNAAWRIFEKAYPNVSPYYRELKADKFNQIVIGIGAI